MLLSLGQIPFYKAVKLFEDKKFIEAAPIFLACTQQGNLYSAHFVRYLEKQGYYKQIKLCEEQTAYLESKLEECLTNFPNISEKFYPHAWLETALEMEGFSLKSVKKKKEIINRLKKWTEYCTYTYIKINEALKADPALRKMLKLETLKVETLKVRDLYFIFSYQENSKYRKLELDTILQFPEVAIKESGAIEYKIGLLYDNIENSLIRGAYWQISSVIMGNAQLALLLATSKSRSMENHLHVEWSLLSASRGNQSAQIRCGALYFLGNLDGFPKDHKRALQMLEKAIPNNLDEFQAKQLSNEAKGSALFYKAILVEKKNTFEDDCYARKLYEKAIFFGDIGSLYHLGLFYLKGKGGVEKDISVAKKYFYRARAEGVGDAILALGNIAFYEDEQSAAHYYLDYINRFGEIKQPSSLSKFASLQFYGNNAIEKNPQAAIASLKKIAAKGYSQASFMLAELLLPICHSSQDFENFGITLEELENLALPDADNEPKIYLFFSIYYLTNHLEDKKITYKTFEFIQKGAALKEPHCLFCLGYLYETGAPEIELLQDDKKAFMYYSIAANMGCLDALNSKGHFLMSGQGCTQNLEEAEELLLTAFNKGSIIAGYNLYILYSVYLPGKKGDFEILHYLEASGSLNDPDVLFELGVNYHCKGIITDEKQAIHYYQRAIEAGSHTAKANLTALLLNQMIHEGTIEDEKLQECFTLIKSALVLKSAIPLAIPLILYGVITLLLYPSKRSEIIDLWANYSEPELHTELMFRLQFLESKDKLNFFELISLLNPNINSEKDIKKFVKDRIITSEQPSKEIFPEKIFSEKNEMKKIIEEIDWFIDPKNRRVINFNQFKKICFRIAHLDSTTVSIRHSKGSNESIRIQLNKSFSKVICYSFHEIHKKGKREKQEHDPKRAHSLVEKMEEIRETLKQKKW